nr:pentapeptide repeat-containing protein [uncultured Desulfobulbus sp.]
MIIKKLNNHSPRPDLNRQQLALLLACSAKKDMTHWNRYRKEHPEHSVLLRKVCLAKAYLRGADLHNADLRGANLRGADLSGERRADFSRTWADLSGADLSKTDLCGTDFRGADLSGVDFSQSYLYYTNLSWTNLNGANFHQSDFWSMYYEATVKDVDLNQAHRRLYQFSRIGCQYSGAKPAASLLSVLRPAASGPHTPKNAETVALEMTLKIAV